MYVASSGFPLQLFCLYPKQLFLALSFQGRSGKKFLNALLCVLAQRYLGLCYTGQKMGDGMGWVEMPMSDIIFFFFFDIIFFKLKYALPLFES